MCCNNLRNIVWVVDGLLEKAIANVWFPIFLHTSLQGSIMGNSMIPFSNLEPKDTAVYKLITTKPGEATAEK